MTADPIILPPVLARYFEAYGFTAQRVTDEETRVLNATGKVIGYVLDLGPDSDPELRFEARTSPEREGYRGSFADLVHALGEFTTISFRPSPSAAGLSTREIAPVTNTDPKTVRNDLREEDSPERSTSEPEEILEGE